MSWEQLNSKQSKEEIDKTRANQKQKENDLAKAYKRMSETHEGKMIIADLNNNFLWNNNTSLEAPNVNYEAAYHNGEAGVVKYINMQILKVDKLNE